MADDVLPAFVSLSKVLSTKAFTSECSELHEWSLRKNASLPDLRMLSIEGAVPTEDKHGKCQWDETARGRPVTQNWKHSLAYPGVRSEPTTAEMEAWATDHLQPESIAKRTNLCAFAGSIDRDPLRSKVVTGCKRLASVYLRANSTIMSLEALDDKTRAAGELYKSSRYCLQPPGTTPSRKGFFDSIMAGCVPVIFDVSYRCGFYDWAYSAQLPRQYRKGYGAGDWSVLLNARNAMGDVHYTMRELEKISDDEYQKMLRNLVRQRVKVSYQAKRTTDFDGVNGVVQLLTHPPPW